MAGTRVYNKDGEQIYPISYAENIITGSNLPKEDVEGCLKDIYSKIGSLSGDDETVNSIRVEVGYKRLNTRNESEVKEITSPWGAFQMPTYEYPYIWKRTVFTYDGRDEEQEQLNAVYEICATYPQIDQTIYKASGDNIKVLSFGYIIDPDTGEIKNLQEVDFTSEGWSTTPQPISASQPYAYMATRSRNEQGLWEKFSEPVQYGNWAFNSILVSKYAITPTLKEPEIAKNGIDVEKNGIFVKDPSNPGNHWQNKITTEFTGYLWMTTATSVNEVLNVVDGAIWSDPTLISIVK